ncbi:MAG: hypothetical protein QOI73_120 [Solirubrobacteraceae bacterium]|nr:hypothetical protein [Solirubrobacteraceae bacterium]
MDCAKWTGSIAVAACLLAGAGPAAAQTAAVPPRLAASLESCETSPLAAERAAAFVGSMPATAGATRMSMRFDLQRRRAGEDLWHRVRGVEGLGDWEQAKPGRAGFVFHKRVTALQVPASYRAVVRFRWQRDDGAVVRSERRRTRACAQPDLRPDLVATSLRAVLDARPALAIYTLTVRNDGRSAAGPFAVRVAGARGEVPALAAGERTELLVVAAACAPGSTVEAIVDVDRRIDESQERNALRRDCPLG